MNQEKNVKFYLLQKALDFLLEQGAITKEECEDASRRNAEILHPDREYIR